MLKSLDRISGRERLRVASALAFWAVTYLLFVTWSQLQDEFPRTVWQTRRLLTTLLGAVIFFAFTHLADHVAGRPRRERIGILAAGSAAALIGIVLGRAGIDFALIHSIHTPPSTLPRHLRFAMIWAGYFAGGTVAFLSFARSVAPARETEPDVERRDSRPVSANDDSLTDSLWVSRGRETVRVPIGSIDWIEAEGDYVRLHAQGGGGLMRGTLTGLEDTLDSRVFARVHRSAICRRSAIVAMLRKPTGAIAVRLENGAEVPVGRRYRDSVAILLGPRREAQSTASA